MRVFLDTNILLDVLLDRVGLVDDSAAVILGCEQRGDTMIVAIHGLATAYYLLRRGRSEEEALLEVDKILAWTRVATATDADARRARGLGMPDFEDALQAVCAESAAADCIVTRNTADFRRCSIQVVTPDEFISRWP